MNKSKEELVNKFTSIIKEESNRKENIDSIKEKEIDMSKNKNSILQWIFNHSKILDAIWGCILLVIISLVIYNVCFSSKYITTVKNMKPFSDKATIGSQLKDIAKSGKWSDSKIEIFGQKAIEVRYEGELETTSNKILDVEIVARYEEGHNNIGDLYYYIGGSEVNPIRFLNFLYNIDCNKITIDNVNSIYPFNISQNEFNKMRTELGLNTVTNTNNVSSSTPKVSTPKTYKFKATKSIDLDVMNVSEVSTDANVINNPNRILLKNELLKDGTDDTIIEDFLSTNYQGRDVKDYLSVMDVTSMEIGQKSSSTDFYIFVSGTLNKTPIDLRFKYEYNSIYLMDSDVNGEDNRRVSCNILKSLIFDNNK